MDNLHATIKIMTTIIFLMLVIEYLKQWNSNEIYIYSNKPPSLDNDVRQPRPIHTCNKPCG